jgi:UDP-N-acetylmuramoyl-tripeptide--D-alanyl-D-alanine ligase
MRAALALLKATPVAEGGRRVAVLGDMLELGAQSEKLHAGLAEPLVDAGVDLVLLAGPHMASLAKALPKDMQVTLEATAEALRPALLGALRPGDVVMVKSSKGIGFSKLVEAMLQKFPADAGRPKN